MKSFNLFIIINLTILIQSILPILGSNQQHVLRFDEPLIEPDPTIPASAPKATGLTAKLIQKITGWNDTVVAKLTGEITPRAPHPFVVSIDDENYEDVIGSELDLIKPGWGSNDETIWIIVVSANDRVSLVFDETFDQTALNSSQAIHPPPPKVREDQISAVQLSPDDPFLFPSNFRFGRIDYMGKTDIILTKWLIFKCPVMVVIGKRGKELRFFKIGGSPPPVDHLAQFIREETWTYKPVWNSTFSPGGSNAWIAEGFGRMFSGLHNITDRVPGWILMMLTSALGTSLMQYLHGRSGSEPKKKPVTDPQRKEELKAALAKAAVKLAEASARRTREKAKGSLESDGKSAVEVKADETLEPEGKTTSESKPNSAVKRRKGKGS